MEQLTKEELAFLYGTYRNNESKEFIKMKQRVKRRHIGMAFIFILAGLMLLFLIKTSIKN